jgi:hypothetical protein
MIYQSMSGDAEVGEAYFSAEGGSITSKAGDMFYITNTDCEITLKNVILNLANDILFRIEGNTSSRGWGTQGANGGDVILTADSQKLNGTILVDSISSLDFTMKCFRAERCDQSGRGRRNGKCSSGIRFLLEHDR